MKAHKPTMKNILDFPEVNLKKVVQIENNAMRAEKVKHTADQPEMKEVGLVEILQFAVAYRAATTEDQVHEKDEVEEIVNGLLKKTVTTSKLGMSLQESSTFLQMIGHHP